jgi:hypothetical protein
MMPSLNTLRLARALLCAAALLPVQALAGPTDPVTVTRPPEGQGPAFVPGTRLAGNLPRNAYVEEEFFVSGSSTLFNYANNPPRSHTDITPVQTQAPAPPAGA